MRNESSHRRKTSHFARCRRRWLSSLYRQLPQWLDLWLMHSFQSGGRYRVVGGRPHRTDFTRRQYVQHASRYASDLTSELTEQEWDLISLCLPASRRLGRPRSTARSKRPWRQSSPSRGSNLSPAGRDNDPEQHLVIRPPIFLWVPVPNFCDAEEEGLWRRISLPLPQTWLRTYSGWAPSVTPGRSSVTSCRSFGPLARRRPSAVTKAS